MFQLFCHPILHDEMLEDWIKLAVPKGSPDCLNAVERQNLWERMSNEWKQYRMQHPSQSDEYYQSIVQKYKENKERRQRRSTIKYREKERDYEKENDSKYQVDHSMD